METISEADNDTASQTRRSRKWLFIPIIVFIVLSLVIGFGAAFFPKRKPLRQLKLADGRILQIEGITYGTHHRMGNKSAIVERFGRWLPNVVNRALGGNQMTGTINTERPALVVWVNAIDSATGTNIDCQGIRVEFMSKDGDLFGEETSSWFGSPSFWRVGHIFYSYPQQERELNWRVRLWRKPKGKNNEPVSTYIKNPHVVTPARWNGFPLPQSKSIGNVEITLNNLAVRTNGIGKKSYYETPARYFEPTFEFRENNQPTSAWEKPEWTAEDAVGNRGQFLGVHSSVLKFFATVYPQATNFHSAQPLVTLPAFDLTTLKTNLFWNKKATADTNEITVLGLFPSGTHTFSEGAYESSTSSLLGPRGGAPSGWTGTSKWVTPLKEKNWNHHYTPSPVIYIQCANSIEPNRFAIRMHDEHGKYWIAKPEPEGAVNGIYPFLVELPNTATSIVAEAVLLKPVQADFLIRTTAKD